MRSALLLVVLLVGPALIAASPCHAERPVVTGSIPAEFSADAAPRERSLLLDGRALAPLGARGADIAQRLKVYFRKGERMAPVRLTGWSHDRIRVQFPGDAWLAQPGTLFVFVKADGELTPPYAIKVEAPPTEPPLIRSVVPKTIVADTSRGSHGFLMRIVAERLAGYHLTSVLVDGQSVPIEWLELAAGVVNIVLPEPFRSRPGRHVIELMTNAGLSQAVEFFVVSKDAPRDDAASLPTVIVPGTGAAVLTLQPMGIETRPDRFEGLRPVQGIVITLEGRVADATEALLMVEHARSMPGVAWVEDRLVRTAG